MFARQVVSPISPSETSATCLWLCVLGYCSNQLVVLEIGIVRVSFLYLCLQVWCHSMHVSSAALWHAAHLTKQQWGAGISSDVTLVYVNPNRALIALHRHI